MILYFRYLLSMLSPNWLSLGGGQHLSSTATSVWRNILRIWCRSSSLASSMFPSVRMLSEVLTRAKSVALKLTVPSALSGMFMATKRWKMFQWGWEKIFVSSFTLQATRCGQSLPKPSGGEIFLSRVTTSTCLMKPLASGSYSDQRWTNSPRWWGPRMDQSRVR